MLTPVLSAAEVTAGEHQAFAPVQPHRLTTGWEHIAAAAEDDLQRAASEMQADQETHGLGLKVKEGGLWVPDEARAPGVLVLGHLVLGKSGGQADVYNDAGQQIGESGGLVAMRASAERIVWASYRQVTHGETSVFQRANHPYAYASFIRRLHDITNPDN